MLSSGRRRQAWPDPGLDAAIGEAASDVSADGVRFIARFEGFRPRLYDDAAGNCTIGFGHLVHEGPTDGSEPPELLAGITRARALELLRADAARAAAAVRDAVRVPLSQCRFDALTSFAYNVGPGAFAESTLLRRLNEGDYAAVPGELARWTSAGGATLAGLVRRRAAEGRLFARGLY
ncbi:MAG: lysozyme [Actinobacteria bacterium]|nr:lysozyme [Actinomycetota bacterium]